VTLPGPWRRLLGSGLRQRGGDRHDDRDAGRGPSFGTGPPGSGCGDRRCRSRPGSSPSISARARDVGVRRLHDSFMTSPSWPVTMTRPAPRILIASMRSRSPPVEVQASPVATPPRPAPRPAPGERAGARVLLDVLLGERPRPLVAAGALPRRLAAEGVDRPLELADARLARVLADHAVDGGVVDRQVLLAQPVLLRSLG